MTTDFSKKWGILPQKVMAPLLFLEACVLQDTHHV